MATCSACRRHTSIQHLFVRTEYTDTPRKLVHAMKFKYSGEAADVIGRELLNTLPAFHQDTIVVPVPTVTGHIRQRGLDHAKRIARNIAVERNLALVPALARTTQARQVGASRQTRLQQMEEAFRVKLPAQVGGARVLLVDDVLTTGATIEAAAKALKDAGAKSIDAIIFAHAK